MLHNPFFLSLGIYKEFGNDYVTSEGNEKEIKEGALKIRVSYCLLFSRKCGQQGERGAVTTLLAKLFEIKATVNCFLVSASWGLSQRMWRAVVHYLIMIT